MVEEIWNLTVSELHDRAIAAGMSTGDYWEALSASFITAPGVVPNIGQSKFK